MMEEEGKIGKREKHEQEAGITLYGKEKLEMVGDKKVKKDIVSNYICERKNNLYDI